MDRKKRKRLEAQGWRVGTAQEFLGLTAAEAELVDMRVSLGASLRTRRERARLTQTAVARRLKSSQSRVAKMEAGDPTVSFDLLIRAHLVLGAKRSDIGRGLARDVAAAMGTERTLKVLCIRLRISPPVRRKYPVSHDTRHPIGGGLDHPHFGASCPGNCTARGQHQVADDVPVAIKRAIAGVLRRRMQRKPYGAVRAQQESRHRWVE